MGSVDYAERVFTKVFNQDIQRLVSMEDMWRSRKPPEPLSFADLSKISHIGQGKTNGKQPELQPSKPVTLKDHVKLDRLASFQLFLSALGRLVQRAQDPDAGPITFDKDDEATLDFVVGAANMRASSFGIESKTIFEVKEMAGNIIPAIATTNAIVAGLVVLQALKVLRNDWSTARMVHFSKKSDKAFSREQLSTPNPNCAVCRNAYIELKIRSSEMTLSSLVKIASDLELGDELVVTEGERLIYDPDFDDNLDRTLLDLDCGPGKMVMVSDETGSKYPIIFIILDNTTSDELFKLGDVPTIAHRPSAPEPSEPETNSNKVNGKGLDPDFEFLVEAPLPDSNKRKRSSSDLEGPKKVAKSTASSSKIREDMVEID